MEEAAASRMFTHLRGRSLPLSAEFNLQLVLSPVFSAFPSLLSLGVWRSGSQGWGISGQFVKCLLAGSPPLPGRECSHAVMKGYTMALQELRAEGHTGPICLLTFGGAPSSLQGLCSVGQGGVLGNSACSEPLGSLSGMG